MTELTEMNKTPQRERTVVNTELTHRRKIRSVYQREKEFWLCGGVLEHFQVTYDFCCGADIHMS